MENRALTLLKAAKDFLIKQRELGYSDGLALTVHYDDADCDGYCIIDDITAYLCDLELQEVNQNEKEV